MVKLKKRKEDDMQSDDQSVCPAWEYAGRLQLERTCGSKSNCIEDDWKGGSSFPSLNKHA